MTSIPLWYYQSACDFRVRSFFVVAGVSAQAIEVVVLSRSPLGKGELEALSVTLRCNPRLPLRRLLFNILDQVEFWTEIGSVVGTTDKRSTGNVAEAFG